MFPGLTFRPVKPGAILSCHLAALSRRYRSVEILPQLRAGVNNSFQIFFSARLARTISRREITIREKNIIAKKSARAAERGAKKISVFARAPNFYAPNPRADRSKTRTREECRKNQPIFVYPTLNNTRCNSMPPENQSTLPNERNVGPGR